MTATAATTYYRTTYGDRAHLNYECANQRRAITSGLPVPTTLDELPPCEFCCDTDTVKTATAAHAAAAAAKAETMCANSGVAHPKRFQTTCNDCGKTGRPTNGRLRAHKPA